MVRAPFRSRLSRRSTLRPAAGWEGAHGGSERRLIPRGCVDEGGRMGRHSGDAYEAAPDEWRPEGGGGWAPERVHRGGHSPVTRRSVLGILGVAGAAAACTAGVSVV